MRSIIQFHFQNWPDFKGVPTFSIFSKLLESVEATHADEQNPITVYCAADRGRTGIFIAAHALRRKIGGQIIARNILGKDYRELAGNNF